MSLHTSKLCSRADSRDRTASWLSHEEKILAAARIKSENVGASVVLDKISKKAYFGGVLNVTTLSEQS